VNERKRHSGSAFRAIRAIDYTVIAVRDMAAMRHFYEDILGFPLLRELSPDWIEYRVGDNTLALARPAELQQMIRRPPAAGIQGVRARSGSVRRRARAAGCRPALTAH
jgi:catechol 2,3-dioxygenase-like lactoylglutathione lyase family enzyme